MRALSGKVVLVTRPADQSQTLVELLHRRGAIPIAAPAIELLPSRSAALTRALRELTKGEFAWLALTSSATVEMLKGRLDSPGLVKAKVAAVGDGTAKAYRRWAGRAPDLRPAVFTTAALAHAFPRGEGRVLCPRADIAPEGLEDAVAKKGWTPLRVDAYRTRFLSRLPKEAEDALTSGRVDAVTFTSASTVRSFVQALRAGAKGNPKVVCIGPVTARQARIHGLTVHAVAKPHTMDGLVSALERAFTPPVRRR